MNLVHNLGVVKSPEVVNIHQAKTHLSRLLVRVGRGEEIIIAKAGKPVARLAPVRDKPKRRVPGTAKGKIWMAPDFDAPLPDEIIDEFYK
ncbi:MAG: type II toxin-antitoxin system Phd/YefM family antitoxin [Acidobacteria bacterium]|nr:type II toxin-antitoxin system Phd/YefM family antitoxin [Acidobacteriota bacterium]